MIILGIPAVDYLTLTTYEISKFRDGREMIIEKNQDKEPRETKKMQYKGNTWGASFAGEGEQRGRPHYMIQVSGGEAQLALPGLSPLDLNPTRVDVQFTLDESETEKVAHELSRESKWRDTDTIQTFLNHAYKRWQWSKGRKKKTNVRTQDGSDTLYIGGREKARLFARLYMKELPGRGFGIRYELELKQDASRQFMKRVMAGEPVRDLCASVLLDEIGKYPSRCPMKKALETAINRAMSQRLDGLTYPTVSTDSTKTLAWLQESVSPAVNRVLNDHDVREDVIHWILSMNLLADMTPEGYKSWVDRTFQTMVP